MTARAAGTVGGARRVPELQLLRPEHAGPVLNFERDNRAYFATMISDRGDGYFADFVEGFEALLSDQAAGGGAYRVLVDVDGSVLGRFNLTFSSDRVAELGYRVAERATGRGLATATVRELCALVFPAHGVRTLRGAVSDGNVASQRVLLNSGFVLAGPADPVHIGGKRGNWYERDVTPGRSGQI